MLDEKSEERLQGIREQLYARCNRQRRWGYGLAGFGLLTVLDSWTVVPVPLMGPSAFIVGCGLFFGGSYLLMQSQELPLREALDVADIHGGYLSGPILVRSLHVTPDTAERMLLALAKNGYATIDDASLESGALGYRVHGLQAPPERPELEAGNPDDESVH